MKLSVSAYRAHASAHKKILSSGYHSQLNYGSTGAGAATAAATAAAAAGTNTSSTSSFGGLYEQSAQCGIADDTEICLQKKMQKNTDHSNTDTIIISPTGTNSSTQDGTFNSQRQHLEDFDDNSQSVSSQTKSPSQRLTYCTERDRLLLPSRDKTVNFAYEQQDHHHHRRQLQQENDSHERKLHMTYKARTHGKAFIKGPTLDCIKERTYQTNLVQCTSLSTSAVNESFNELLTPYRGLSWTRRHSLNALTDIFQPPQERPTDIRLNARAGVGVGVGVGVGTQKWKNLKAVMAYYCSLKRIKRTKSNQRWMKLRTTVQISSAIQKKPPLKREDSFLKRFSTRQVSETQETIEDTGSEGASGDAEKSSNRRRRYLQRRKSVVNPDENFYFYWLMLLTICVLYNLWTLIVRQSFPELQNAVPTFWCVCDVLTDAVFVVDIIVQLRTGYLEQGLMVYDDKKLACHYVHSRDFIFDIMALIPFDLLQLKMGTQPLLRFTRFFKAYRTIRFYYIVESRTVWPNLWRVVNLIHILLILAHWFGCFYYLLSEAENFQGDWVYPYRPGDYATLTRKYLGSLYWSTLTLTTIGDLPTPETNAEYIFTIVSYLIGVFIFATIVGQVGNVITNRNANRLEFERLLDGAKTYMRHHKVPGGMKRRVLRWYDYSWSRGRIQGGGDINTALGLLPDKLKTELALHVNLSVLKKVTIFQECQPEFLHDLVLKMKAYIFTPGDSICRKGEVAREMFIIADGILEVLSETGKVLTTMKAGDFFGEIGILNLDGLNKRTADVRSVGYSELFSLSREDVLAAMKDYPEAQEILQTLGRKRLMEVRCVNKKYSKHTNNDKESNGSHQHSQSTNQSTESRMVEKFKNDVKGLRNALKISRAQRKSLDIQDVQMQNLSPPKDVKSVLKRISRVRSEEKVEKTSEMEDKETLHQDKTPSPIGAGLPLLQRLRLLREKQDREERAVKATPTTQKSPTHTHVTNTLSPQESIREEPERETIEVSISRANESTDIMNEATTSKEALTIAKTSTTAKSLGKTNWHKLKTPMGAHHNNNNSKSNNNRTDNQALSIQQLDQSDQTFVSDNSMSSKGPDAKKIIKPSKLTVDTNPILMTTSSTPTTPWSRLKFATLFSSSYTNLPANLEQREDMPLKNYSLGNIPQTIAEEGSSSSKDISQISVNFHKPYETKQSPRQFKDRLAVKRTNSMTRKVKKFYRSVFDLSPEYNGLPFVKRLKILNDRQRLAELEKSVQSRSYSLDSSKTSSDFPVTSSLYRCYSDTSCIYSRLLTRNDSYSTITSTNTSVSECTQLRCSNASMQLDNVTPAYVQLGSDLKEVIDESQHLNFNKPNLEHEVKEKEINLHLSPNPSLILPENFEQVQDQEAQAFTKKSFLSRSNSLKENIGQKTKISGPKNNIYAQSKLLDRSPVGFSTSHISQIKAADNLKPTISRNNLKYSEVYEHNKIAASQGFPEAQECFNHILYGINSVIKTNMNEMHMRFKSQFSIMADEIKSRDKIIADLQYKLQYLETRSATKTFARRNEQRARYVRRLNNESKDEYSSDSSAELLFLRGDSHDTVQRPLESHLTMTPSTSKNGTQTLGAHFSHFGESIVLDIGDSTSTSSSPSSGKSNLRLSHKPFIHGRNEEIKDVLNVRHNDWEVRMLAAEMEKQERKRGYSLSESITEFAELECTDTETEDVFCVATRPRASSLDQFNLTHGRGSGPINNKHFNFKRDREKL